MSLDTRKAVRDLRASGADEQLADAIVDLFREAADLPDVAQLATKDDVALSKADIRADIAEVKAELEVKIATIDAKITMLMWMIGILGGGALVLQVLTSTLRVLHVG